MAYKKIIKKGLVIWLLVISLIIQILSMDTVLATNTPEVSKNDAINIATAFVHDTVVLNKSTNWTKNTKINNIVTLYDVQDDITGYSIELSNNGKNNGYIVISAYNNIDIITEFSDKAEPMYKTKELKNDEKILYTGSLEYYKKDSNNIIKDFKDNKVDKKRIQNSYKNINNKDTREKNIKLLKNLKTQKTLINEIESDNITIPKSGGTASDGTIVDPFAWAQSEYNATFTSYQYRNIFEQYCSFLVMPQFDNLPGSTLGRGHCGPTAITNIMVMQHNKGIFPSIPSSVYTLYSNVGRKWNEVTANPITIGDIQNLITDCYSIYGRTAWVSGTLFKGSGSDNGGIYNHVKICIDADHPLWINLYATSNTAYNQSNNAYAVAGYAYTRLRNNTTGYFSSFIKIMDGMNPSGRYVSMDNLRGTIYEINLR